MLEKNLKDSHTLFFSEQRALRVKKGPSEGALAEVVEPHDLLCYYRFASSCALAFEIESER
jgi:hypothetical protein